MTTQGGACRTSTRRRTRWTRRRRSSPAASASTSPPTIHTARARPCRSTARSPSWATTPQITDGTAWAQASDTALQSIQNEVQRVRELVVEAANGTNSQCNLSAIEAEVKQLTDAIKQDANAQYDGKYIFSGPRPGRRPTRAPPTPTRATRARSSARSGPPDASRSTRTCPRSWAAARARRRHAAQRAGQHRRRSDQRNTSGAGHRLT